MMALVASQVAGQLATLLSANVSTAAIQVASAAGIPTPAVGAAQVISGNVAAELTEKALGAQYPFLRVFCERVTNTLREKFRTFSGQVQLVTEALVSQDRLEGLEDQLHVCVDAVTNVLDANRGDWGSGSFYNGGYDIAFGSVKHGGKNFLQSARVSIMVDVSK